MKNATLELSQVGDLTPGQSTAVIVSFHGDAIQPAGNLRYAVSGPDPDRTLVGQLELPQGKLSLPNLAVGNYTLEVAYSGDSHYAPTSALQQFTVSRITPTLAAAPVAPLQALTSGTLRATIAAAQSSAPAFTGTLTYRIANGANGQGTCVLDGAAACFAGVVLPGGDWPVTWDYPGDRNYNAAHLDSVISVAKLAPALRLTGPATAPTVTSSAVFTTILSGNSSAPPTGNVQWQSTASCATGAASGVVVSPATTFTLADVCAGTYTVTATYAGDANYMAQSGSVTMQVDRQADSLSLMAPAAASNADAPVSLQLAWTGTSAQQPPSGTVTVRCVDSSICDPVQTTLPAASLEIGPFSQAGTIPLIATYAGDDRYAPATAQATLQTTAPFSVTVNQNALVYPGGTADLTVQVAAGASLSGTVAVALSDLPSDLQAPGTSVTVGSTGTVTLSAGSHVAAESFRGNDYYVANAQRTLTLTATGRRYSTHISVPLLVSLQNAAFTPSRTYLPVLDITTASPVTDEENYISGSARITDAKNSANNWSGSINLRGRGNSTWSMPKKPYSMKLASKAVLLGMAKAKNWVLLANYDDKTLLRNATAFEIGQRLGMTWTPHSTQVEMYLNGSYQGVYQLTEKVEIDSNRLNLTSLGSNDNSGTAVTGGYLMEIDHHMDEDWYFFTPSGEVVAPSDPDPLTSAQETYIQNVIDTADQAIFSENYTDRTTGWPAYLDQSSFVNFYLANEFLGNQDAGNFFSSVYLYKDRGESLIHMGPLWDFDISSGNVNYSPSIDPRTLWMAYNASWYARLLSDPAFHRAVHDRWVAVRPQFVSILDFIDTQATTLAGAQANNFARWPILGELVWPNPAVYDTYAGEIANLKSWLATRVTTLDEAFGTQ